MVAHVDNGWHKMFALTVNWGDSACAMERVLQSKLSDHLPSKIAHRGYKRGPINGDDSVILYALVKYA